MTYVVTTNQYDINVSDPVHKKRDMVGYWYVGGTDTNGHNVLKILSNLSPQLWFDDLT